MGANPIRQPLQPEAIGAVMEVTKWLKRSTEAELMRGKPGVRVGREETEG